uniref:Uncharacterized protein n=1 Tax=Panagrolaimus superbus TaxID=310955 RepID=A0A914Z231_9BILA
MPSSAFEIYSNMDVTYFATMAESTVNLLIMVKEPFDHAYDHFNLTLENIPLCKKGAMIGYFQYMSTNNPIQRTFAMAIPMNYETPTFVKDNYQRLISNATTEAINCTFLKKFLRKANTMPHNREQWNLLLIQDPYLSCFSDFDLFWNNTMVSIEVLKIAMA